MNMLYPLKFKPVFKEKIWGGQKVKTRLGLDFSPLPNCGEVWALSGVPGYQTEIINGFLQGNELNEILEIYMDELVGEKVYEKYQNEFPVLIKFIDANDYLSVQVHPDDALAARRKIGNGKSEMWYILDAEPNAELISGFNREMDPRTFLEYLHQKKLKEILNVEKVKKGDIFNIPAGRIHALGPGILLAEIQQTSDITYRIYDWDRRDDQGNPRTLHTDEALEAIDFHLPESVCTRVHEHINKTTMLVNSPHFITSLLSFDQMIEKDYEGLDSFVALVGVAGNATVKMDSDPVSIKPGEVVLLPAITERATFIPHPAGKILEVHIDVN
ncbi:MAG: class I mannose-6-phosphate isomerase [Bacteroidales bacterium]|nr:class I mannose-6-phosphate isomerase [Bacteroidales bacterium]